MSPLFLIPTIYSLCAFLYLPEVETLFSLIYIAICSLPFALLHLPTPSLSTRARPSTLQLLKMTSIILGAINLSVIANSTGYDWRDLLDFEGVTKIAIQSTINRYEIDSYAQSGSPLILSTSLFLIFAVNYIEKSPINASITIMPVILYSLLTTEKWPSFLAITFFMAASILSPKKISKEIFLRLLILLAIVIAVMVMSLIIRSGTDNPSEIFDNIFNYLFSQYYGFGHWLLNEGNKSLTYGATTFMGPLNQLGLIQRHPGAGFESYYLNGNESNIYTAYKYLIMDFGDFSPLFINVYFAYLLLVFKRCKFNRIYAGIYTFLIFSSLMSLNVTVFVHNSTALAVLFCIALIFILNKKETNHE